jgi:DNA-binding NarL/FixJ family response regulator
MHDEALFAERALRAGARGYIMKSEAPTALVGAIRDVVAGRVYLSATMIQRVLQRLRHEGAAPQDVLSQLADRERELLD